MGLHFEELGLPCVDASEYMESNGFTQHFQSESNPH